MADDSLRKELKTFWNKGSEHNWEVGRLGNPNGSGYDIDVPDRPGYVYVNKGDNGNLGLTIAEDKIGVAHVGNQLVKMRRELGRLVIREAEYLASANPTLAALTDVDLTSLTDGDLIQWDTGTSRWVNISPTGVGGGAPSPHARSGIHHIGLEAWSNIDTSTSNLTDIATRNHSDLQGITANQHHNQVHALVGSDHTASGLTAGHVVRASGATTFAWAQLQHTDLGGITPDQHHDPVTVGNTGLSLTTQVVSLNLAATSGLQISSGLMLADTVAGAGLAITSKVMNVVAANGSITVNANDLNVNLAHNWAWTGNHTFSTGAVQFNTDPQVNANLDFIGATPRSITAANSILITPAVDLTMNPTGDAYLTPGDDATLNPGDDLNIIPGGDVLFDAVGNVYFADDQNVRSVTYSDLVTGINGFRLWERTDAVNYWQLTAGAAKFDELYARVFVADEVRIDRGEEYWSKSFGVVETDFVLPALGVDVDVWFEDAPALGSANLFSVNDWLLARVVDWSTGILIMKVWFQVQDAGALDYVSKDTTNKRQQWRLRRKKFGTTGKTVKKGSCLLDAGQPGQGWLHLSALNQDGGPFFQVGIFDSVVSDEPIFTNHVRMGRLDDVGLMTGTDKWGFAAGNDLADGAPSTFSGFTVDATDGLKLYNTAIELYSGGNLSSFLNNADGLGFLQDTALVSANVERAIKWYDTVVPLGDVVGEVKSYTSGGGVNNMIVRAMSPGTDTINTILRAQNSTGSAIFYLAVNAGGDKSASLTADTFSIGGDVSISGTNFDIWNGGFSQHHIGLGHPAAVSTVHIYENTSNTGATAGLTIEQDGTGDAVLQFLLTGGQRFVMGIDNSDGDKFKITDGALGSAEIFAIDPVTNYVGIGTGSPSSHLHIKGDSTSSDLVFEVNTFSTRTYFSQYQGATASFSINRDITGAFSNTGAAAAAMNMVALSGDSNIGFYTSTTNNTTPALALFIDKNQRVGVNALKALSSSGLKLLDDANIPGVWIQDGGLVDLGPGADGTTTYTLRVKPAVGTPAIFSVDAGTAGTAQYAVVNVSANGGYMQFASQGTTVAGTRFGQTLADSGELLTVGLSRLLIGTYDNAPVIFGTNNTFAAIIDTAGKVGINEASPGTFLDVGAEGAGGVRSTVYGTSYFQFLGRRAMTSQASPAALASGTVIAAIAGLGYTSGGWHANTNAEIQFVATEDYNSGTTGKGGSAIKFFTRVNGASSVTERMSLGHDGLLTVVGVATFQSAMSLTGTFTANGAFVANGTMTALAMYSTSVGATNKDLYIDNTGKIGPVPSSLRYKTDIRELPSYYNDHLIMGLRPVVYRQKNDPAGPDQLGFIAEEVDALGAKELVSYGDDGMVESVHYSRFIVPTIAATQRLISEVRELKAQVKALQEMRTN